MRHREAMELPFKLITLLLAVALLPSLMVSAVGGYFYPKRLAVLEASKNKSAILVQVTQYDGKTLLGGQIDSDTALVRKNIDGTLDNSFMASCTTSFNGPVRTVAIQRDNKILVGGDFTRFDLSLAGHIVRLNVDGSIDPSFSLVNGVGFDDEVYNIELDQSGKIWVSGKFENFDGDSVGSVVRLNADGSLDRTASVSEMKSAKLRLQARNQNLRGA